MIFFYYRLISTNSSDELRIKFNNIMKKFDDFESQVYEKWQKNVPQVCEINTKKNLLIKDNSLLRLNFSHEVNII